MDTKYNILKRQLRKVFRSSTPRYIVSKTRDYLPSHTIAYTYNIKTAMQAAIELDCYIIDVQSGDVMSVDLR